jgi:hypothetical protein
MSGLDLIRLVGQLDLATQRPDVPLDAYVLQEFGVAGPADPADRLTGRPSLSGLWPGPILLPRTDIAGLSVWWDDFHVQINERPLLEGTARWLHPLRLESRLPGSLR